MNKSETVLVVDDRRDSIEFLTEYILRPAGYHISLALDGEQGLHKALEEKPDLVNKDPYGEGWLIKVKIDDAEQVNNLLDAESYKKMIEV